VRYAYGTKSARASSPSGGIGRGSTGPPYQPAPIAPVPSVSKEKSGPSGLHLYVVGVDKQWRKRIAALGGLDLRKHPSRRYRSPKKGAPTFQPGAPSFISRQKAVYRPAAL
jgi:hypothetical protein